MTLKTVDIKGKSYVTVNERLKYFRESFQGYSLESELIAINDETALVRAVIRNDQGTLVATGTAYERRDDKASFVNKTSHVENAETSAWGRALANFGIGIDANVASADELVLAIQAQEQPQVQKDRAHTGVVLQITQLCKETGTDEKELYNYFKAKMSLPTKEQGEKMLASLKKKLNDQLNKAA